MSDAFASRGFVGVVNGAHLALASKPLLEPYVRLAEALGSLQGQMLHTSVKASTVLVEMSGPAFANGELLCAIRSVLAPHTYTALWLENHRSTHP